MKSAGGDGLQAICGPESIQLRQLGEAAAKRFVAARRRRGIKDHSELHTCRQFLLFLHDEGHVPVSPSKVTSRAACVFKIRSFCAFSTKERVPVHVMSCEGHCPGEP